MHTVGRLVAAALITTAMGTGLATAADVYIPPPAAPPPVFTPTPVFDWSGLYFGVQGGGDFNQSTTISPGGYTSMINGGLVGLYGGYNWQVNSIVFGIDASINYDWASGPVSVAPGYMGEVDWKGFIRGRLGVALAERFLLYGTAGGSVANLKLTDTTPACPGASGATCGSPTAWGWTVGAGGEWALSNKLTTRLDYAYANYGTYAYSNPVSFTATNQSHTVTLGLAVKY